MMVYGTKDCGLPQTRPLTSAVLYFYTTTSKAISNFSRTCQDACFWASHWNRIQEKRGTEFVFRRESSNRFFEARLSTPHLQYECVTSLQKKNHNQSAVLVPLLSACISRPHTWQQSTQILQVWKQATSFLSTRLAFCKTFFQNKLFGTAVFYTRELENTTMRRMCRRKCSRNVWIRFPEIDGQLRRVFLWNIRLWRTDHRKLQGSRFDSDFFLPHRAIVSKQVHNLFQKTWQLQAIFVTCAESWQQKTSFWICFFYQTKHFEKTFWHQDIHPQV